MHARFFKECLGLSAALFSVLSVPAAESSQFPAPHNTQQETIPFVPAAEAVKMWKLPPGFTATLAVSEPELQQPIGMTFDARGRLWVAENYTYAENPKNFDTSLRDRILIFQDADGDGKFEKRKVFWDKASKLTSVAIGFGGVYALCAPQMLFIPDKDGDDVPDGEPEVLLDGFDHGGVRHNIVNGLKWGPDGWLYGRHGIQATSNVGKPGAPREERVPLNCSVWRFHPTSRKFEVVFRGTTNPWGHDWDEHGQLFLINTVIGHLWHVVPGAFTRRMYGEHFNPHLYELIDQTADHVHWSEGEKWDEIRKGVSDATSAKGGGHAHSGFMIYLGNNWPAEFRNHAFTLNYHGRRINHDTIERAGATYTAKHSPDLGEIGDPWFRGIELDYGPDGSVFVLDWSDIGECHDNDGVHRSSGRIYKIAHGKPAQPTIGDVAKLSNSDLVRLQTHENEWFARVSGRVLQERAASGQNMSESHEALRKLFESAASIPGKLRAMWRLHVTGGASERWLRTQLDHNNEHIRAWAVLLLTDHQAPNNDVRMALSQRAQRESSGLVLTMMTSALHRMEPAQRWELATAIAAKSEFARDRVLPLLLWYALEPAVTQNPKQALAFVQSAQMPKARNFVARRLTTEMESKPEPVNALVEALPRLTAGAQLDVLTGMNAALRGWKQASAPAAWTRSTEGLMKSSDANIARVMRELGVLFGDGRAIDELKVIVADANNDANTRRQALQALVQARAENLTQTIQPLLREMEIGPDAVRALGVIGAAQTPELLVREFPNFRSQTARVEAINALAARPATAKLLLQAVANNTIPRQHVTAFQLQQLRILNDPEIDQQMAKIWPELKARSADKREQIAKYKAQFTPEKLKSGNAARGRETYVMVCGACHKMYGEGGEIGPDLTGSDRKNLDYILDNVIDPSGIVPEGFRASTVSLKDGRSLNGVVGGQTERTITVQTATEKTTLDRREIESIATSELSLMPEGLFDAMEEKDVLDLIAYLQSTEPPRRR